MNQKTNYLERAMTSLRSVGVTFPAQAAPVVALLEKIAQYDNTKVAGIAATLQQSSAFNAAVRDQIQGMEIATRFSDITAAFESIRNDAQQMAEWMADGKIDMKERIQLGWMKMRRGSIPDRFADIRNTYLSVSKSASDQLDRENLILESYRDFRLALKEAEIDAQEVLKIASAALETRKATLQAATAAVESYAGQDAAERSKLELTRDEALRALQNEDKAAQTVKDIADDLKTSYNTAELVFARLQQTHDVKDRLYQRSVTFFSTNEVVFTGLSASFTSMAGLGEATNVLNSMTDGLNRGLEALASTGGKQLEAGLRAGYGSTLQVSSVQTLANAILEYQEGSQKLINELRAESTRTAQEIEAATEDAKHRFIALLDKGV